MKIEIDYEREKCLRKLLKEAKTVEIKQTEEYKKITEEANQRIIEGRLRYAQAYENAKGYVCI